MKICFILLITIFLFPINTIYAETPADNWNTMSRDGKDVFLSGYLTGILEEQRLLRKYLPEGEFESGEELIKEIYSIHLNGQLLKGVDYYYSKYENANLPMYALIIAVIARMKGMTEQEIETVFVASRKAGLEGLNNDFGK